MDPASVEAELRRLAADDATCRICLEPLPAAAQHKTALLPCGHTFCRSCVATHAQEATLTCPVCFAEHRGVAADRLPANPFLAAAEATANCPEHGRPLDAACTGCDAVGCGACLAERHPLGVPPHAHAPLAHHSEQLQKALGSAVQAAAARQAALVQRIAATKATAAATHELKASLVADIRAQFAALHTLLDRRMAALLEAVETQIQADVDNLNALAERDGFRWLALDGAIKLARQLLTPGLVPAQVVGRVAPATRQYLASAAQPAVPAAPEVVHVSFQVAPATVTAIETAGTLRIMALWPDACEARGDGIRAATVHTSVAFTVTAVDRGGHRLAAGGHTVAMALRQPAGAFPGAAAAEDLARDVKVVDHGNGLYTVSYRGSRPGPHALHVTLNGKPIKGSPFGVDVRRGQMLSGTPGQASAAPSKRPLEAADHSLATYLKTGVALTRTRKVFAECVAVAASPDLQPYAPNFFVNAPVLWGYKQYSDEAGCIGIQLLRHALRPTGYAIRNYNAARLLDADSRRHGMTWSLQASRDGTAWTVLKLHENDTSLNGDHTVTFRLDETASPVEGWTQFRICVYHPALVPTGFDLQGEVFLLES